MTRDVDAVFRRYKRGRNKQLAVDGDLSGALFTATDFVLLPLMARLPFYAVEGVALSRAFSLLQINDDLSVRK